MVITSEVYNKDKKNFLKEIKDKSQDNREISIYTSFAYLTPNYNTLFILTEIKEILNKIPNSKIYLIFWDMNTIAHPYIKKEIYRNKIDNYNQYISDKIKEVKKITKSIGIEDERINYYKSSDLWKRLISYKGENIFQSFYSILSNMKIKNYVEANKISNLLQIPLDIFFCNYFNKIFPEDINKSIDIVFTEKRKLKLYEDTRNLINEEIKITKKPYFYIINDFQYFLFEGKIPEWNMSKDEILYILNNLNVEKNKTINLFKNINKYVKCKVKDNEISLGELDSIIKESNKSKTDEILSENLYNYLQFFKEKFSQIDNLNDETIWQINNKNEIKNLGKVFKSNLALEILLLSDGTKSISEISKKLKKSIATISSYTAKLKKLNLIKDTENKKIKRNLKGIKINFDLGIE